MQRISITEDDLGTAVTNRPPAVYAPVGGTRHPDVYGPAADRSASGAEARNGLPAWAMALLVAGLVLAVGLGAFFLGRSSGTSQAEVQQQITTQKAQLAREAEREKEQAVTAARNEARREADSRVRRAATSARHAGFAAGHDAGYQEGLVAGRSEGSCTGLFC